MPAGIDPANKKVRKIKRKPVRLPLKQEGDARNKTGYSALRIRRVPLEPARKGCLADIVPIIAQWARDVQYTA